MMAWSLLVVAAMTAAMTLGEEESASRCHVPLLTRF